MKLSHSINPAVPAYPLLDSRAQSATSSDVAAPHVAAPSPLVPGSARLELTAPVAALAGVSLAKAANDKATAVQARKPLANPQAFAKEAVEKVIYTWQNPEDLQPGQAPMEVPNKETMAKAIAGVVSELSKFDAGFKDYARIQTVDAETQAALVEAGLCSKEEAATFLNANSNADWSNLAAPAGRIRAQLIDLLGYQPNDTQRGKAKHGLIGFFVR